MHQSKYTWDAKDYAVNSANQFSWAQELIPKLRLTDGEALMDIGCGDGKITAEIAHCLPNGKVVGVDSSTEMIILATRTYPTEKYPNMSFHLMDARSLPFREEFDVVFSNAALHWILDQKSVLASVERSLKHGGRLLFQMAGKGNAAVLYEVLDDLKRTERYCDCFKSFIFPYSYLNPQEYKQLLLQACLEPIRLELTDNKMKFNNVEELTGCLRTTWLPYTERVPTQQRNEYIKNVVDGYLRVVPLKATAAFTLE